MQAAIFRILPEIIKMSPVIQECEGQVTHIINGLIDMGVNEKAIGQAFNLGSGKEQRVIDMAKNVNRLTGNESGIQYKERSDWDVKTMLLSCITKAEKVLPYKPQMTFEDGKKETHRWFVENWDAIKESAEF
jgi:nucleoside-diphosphate-sugar epimerase